MTAAAEVRHREPVTDLITLYGRHLHDVGRTDATITTYIDQLRRMDRELPHGLIGACTDELYDWIHVDGRARATRALYRTIACAFFDWATAPAAPRLDFNPAALLPRVSVPQRQPRPIPTNVLGAILARSEPPCRVWLMLAAYAGLRCIEIAALDREHVTDEQLWVQGKGEKERTVPTHPLLWEAVRPLPAGPIATGPDGARATRQYVSHRSNDYVRDRLGFPGVTMHRLRHWFGTAAYAASGSDIRAVQELLGHSSVATTQRYVAATAAGKARAVANLPRCP